LGKKKFVNIWPVCLIKIKKNVFYVIFSLIDPFFGEKRIRDRKFTGADICYIQNSFYVCNEIIDDSLLPRSSLISRSEIQCHLSNQIEIGKLPLAVFDNNSNHKKKMKQIISAPGKVFIALTLFSLTHIAGNAQSTTIGAMSAVVLPAQKLQAVTLNNSTVTISWQANTQIIANCDVELERSFDQAEFKTICYVMSPEGGEAFAPICAFKDKQAMQQNKAEAYYRLKQIDKSGNITYSEVVTVKLK
jgi:hypothetical protein